MGAIYIKIVTKNSLNCNLLGSHSFVEDAKPLVPHLYPRMEGISKRQEPDVHFLRGAPEAVRPSQRNGIIDESGCSFAKSPILAF